jgi:monoamine oxidase
MRLTGGTAALVSAMAQVLPAGRMHLGSAVTGLSLRQDRVRLTLRDTNGGVQTIDAEYVIAALPPRLLQGSVDFTPGLPPDTSALWRETPTWMASHAKFFALYGRPFWLEAGYSGTAQSMVGPMLEIHDATTWSGHAALFGFLGVGAAERLKIRNQKLIEACLAQFGRIFGQDAQAPTATLYKDWATDPLTATPDDPTSTGHPASAPSWVRGPWGARLVLVRGLPRPQRHLYRDLDRGRRRRLLLARVPHAVPRAQRRQDHRAARNGHRARGPPAGRAGGQGHRSGTSHRAR